ncbi:MAG: outer membrane beta-barrel protein [Cyclobacteriaceae bacterium]
MKKNYLLLVLAFVSTFALCQENVVTLSGGYSFANIEDTDANANGFRINGLYEFNPMGGKFAHGLSIGYIGTKANTTLVSQPVDYKINNWPVYYAPKFMFGGEDAKGFVKGALGWQWSNIKRTGIGNETSFNDSGIYVGASVGGMKSLSEKVFFNLEYEWAYMSNSFYRDGFMNTIMAGFGMKF